MKKWKKFLISIAAALSISALVVNSVGAVQIVTEMPGDYSIQGSFGVGTNTITMTSEATGHGTITPSADAASSYYVISHTTGGVEDHLDIGTGTYTGQQIRVTLFTDGETSGLLVIPRTLPGAVSLKNVGTSTLLEDIGDSVLYEWTSTHWQVVSNIGGTEL